MGQKTSYIFLNIVDKYILINYLRKSKLSKKKLKSLNLHSW